MAIESVSSATFTPPQPRTEQSTQATQASQTEQSRQASEARPAEPTSQDNAAAETLPPQPVVNTQGQMTGRVINAIA